MSAANIAAAIFVFAVGFGLFGYRISVRHRILRGVTPWRLPSIVWALICSVTWPIGIIVELVAEFTTRSELAPTSGPAVSTGASFPPPSTPPVYPGQIGDAGTAHHPIPPTDGSGKTALFGWYPDGTGRHELRYWDGRRWSENVADNGVVGSDPL